jgi:hypothetical protein
MQALMEPELDMRRLARARLDLAIEDAKTSRTVRDLRAVGGGDYCRLTSKVRKYALRSIR